MAKKSTNVHANTLRVAQAGLGALGRAAPGAAAVVARGLFSLPKRHPRPAREQALLATARPFTFVGPRGLLHQAWRFGRGPKVLLVHGWEGRGAQLGAMVPPLVASGHEVLLFDAKAHGDTPGRRVDAADVADAVARLARIEGPLRAVVGHSMGGMAAAASRRLGTRADRWVVMGSPLSPEGAVRLLARTLALTPEVTRQVQRRIGERLGAPWPELVGGALFRDGEAPLLVVHDHDDDEVPMTHAPRIVSAWGPSELYATRGLGHRRILWEPSVVQTVTQFVSGERDHAQAARAAS